MKKTNNSVLSQYRGALMGISIILIIVFHFTDDCHYYSYHFSGWISFFWRYISSSSVDAFLFFSGLGLYYSMKKRSDVRSFYIRRLKRILIPYCIVAVPSYILLDVCVDKTGWGEAIKDFTFITFFSDGDRLYWYIGLMLLCYLIYPYIFQIVDSARDAIDGEIRLISMVSAVTVLALVIALYEKDMFGNVNIALLRLGLYYSMKKRSDVRSFYIRRLKRILIPYCIVAVPSYILLDVCVDKTGWGEAIKDFTFITFFSDGDRLYWYIGLMLLCYLIYPYIFQIVDSARDAIDGEIRLISMVSAVTVLALVIALYEKDMFGNVNIALLRLPVFIAGCFYGRSSYEKRESYWKWLILFALSGYLLTMLPSGSPIFARYVTGIFNISCCAGIAWIFSQLSMRPVIRILEWFGAHSLELYLVHVTIRKFMKGAAFHTCRLRYELVLVCSSIVIAWILQILVRYITDHLLKEKR